MSTNIAGLRLDRYSAATYRAFLLSDVTPGKVYPLKIGNVTSLKEAIAAAQASCLHKNHLAIRVEEAGKVNVHLYAIKRKSAPSYEYHYAEIRRVHTLYADPICVMGAEVFG